MDFENPASAEKEPRFPSPEQVRSEIERLSGQENLEELRTLDDEKGLYLYEAVAVDGNGEGKLYSYTRAGNYSETKSIETIIDLAYFRGDLEDGEFIGGRILSKYDEETGGWTDQQ